MALGTVVTGVWSLAACGRTPPIDPWAPAPSGAASSPAGPGPPGPGPAASGACEYVPSGQPARPVRPPSSTGVPDSGTVSYLLTTNEGEVTITLDRSKAPCTVHSFVSLAEQGFFDQTSCPRLVDSGIFLLQCGDPTGTGRGGPGYTFADETDGTESYTAGVVAMANAGPHTGGSQFLLFWDDSTLLDQTPDFTIFGRMDEKSRQVVARIAAEGQDGSNPSGGGKPNNPAQILRVTKRA